LIETNTDLSIGLLEFPAVLGHSTEVDGVTNDVGDLGTSVLQNGVVRVPGDS